MSATNIVHIGEIIKWNNFTRDEYAKNKLMLIFSHRCLQGIKECVLWSAGNVSFRDMNGLWGIKPIHLLLY